LLIRPQLYTELIIQEEAN